MLGYISCIWKVYHQNVALDGQSGDPTWWKSSRIRVPCTQKAFHQSEFLSESSSSPFLWKSFGRWRLDTEKASLQSNFINCHYSCNTYMCAQMNLQSPGSRVSFRTDFAYVRLVTWVNQLMSFEMPFSDELLFARTVTADKRPFSSLLEIYPYLSSGRKIKLNLHVFEDGFWGFLFQQILSNIRKMDK